MCIQLYANIISFEFTFFVKSACDLDTEERENENTRGSRFYIEVGWPDVTPAYSVS